MILSNNKIDEYVLKEFSIFEEDAINFKPLKIHNRLLNKLKKNYYCHEFTEHFYDDYEHYDGTPMTDEERMSWCNWVEPMFKGNWGMPQCVVDKWALNQLKKCRKWNIDKSHRFYIKDSGDTIFIYAFGRDKYYSDFWWIYYRNGYKIDWGECLLS